MFLPPLSRVPRINICLLSDVSYTSFPKGRILSKIAVGGVYLAGVTQTGLVLLDVLSATKASIANKSVDASAKTILKPEHSLWPPALTAVGGGNIVGIEFWLAVLYPVATVIQSLFASNVYSNSKTRAPWFVAMGICVSHRPNSVRDLEMTIVV